MTEKVSHKKLLNKIEEEKSEEVRDIVERIPQTFTLVIIIFLIFIVSVLILFGFTINYPDTVSGWGTLNASQSYIKIVMPSNGKIIFDKIKPKQYIKEGQVIALVSNPADLYDIMFLKDLLTKNNPFENKQIEADSIFPNNLNLGELNVAYYQYKNLLNTLCNEEKNSLYQQNIDLTTSLTLDQRKSLKQLQNIKETLYENLKISKISFQRDSLLYVNGVIAQANLEKSNEQYLQIKRSYQQSEADVINYKYSISSSLGRVQQLEIEKENHIFELRTQIINGYANLLAQLSNWEKTYTIIAPISGRIEFLQFWTHSQYIQVGTEVFSIIPDGDLTRLEVAVPSDGVGKVKIGQDVIIKLEDFPYKEYGFLKGKVTDISLTKLPTDKNNFTLVIVELIQDNITNYEMRLNLKYGMKATAEIITEDKKLIERLFEKIKYVTKK